MRPVARLAVALAFIFAVPAALWLLAHNEIPLASRDALVIFGFLLLVAGVLASLPLAAAFLLGPESATRRALSRLARPAWGAPLASVAIILLAVAFWRPPLHSPTEPAFETYPPPQAGRILLIGVDGLCWETLERWRRQAKNPDLEWLLVRGCAGPLATIEPTDSPVVWSTIVTGVPPAAHGVKGFRSFEFPALERTRVDIPSLPGRDYLLRALLRSGLAELRPVSSLDMRRRPFWEIVCRPERPCDVAGFWATWPPQPFHGRLLSDRFYFLKRRDGGAWEQAIDPFTTFPPQMEKRLAGFRIAPEQLSDERLREFVAAPEVSAAGGVLTELRYGLAIDETYFPIAEQFLDDGAKNGIFAFYFRGLDVISHPALAFSDLYPGEPVREEDRRRFGGVVSRYYAYLFARIRRLVELAGKDAVVLIVSDHGFERERPGYFHHHFAPPGVLIALGGGASRVSSPPPASIYDLAPTILWLTGFPPSRDMPGKPLVDLFPDLDRSGLAHARPPRSYGNRWSRPPLKAPADPQSEQRMLDLLRTLGYIR